MDIDEDVRMGNFSQESVISSSTIHEDVSMNGHLDDIENIPLSDVTGHGSSMVATGLGIPLQSSIDPYLSTTPEATLDGIIQEDSNTTVDGITDQDNIDATITMEETMPQSLNVDASNISIYRVSLQDAAPRIDIEDGTIMSDQSSSPRSSNQILGTTSPITTDTPSVVIMRPPDPKLPYSSRRTGLVYDPRMRFHTELGATEDDIHPEDPRRIWEIYSELKLEGLLEDDYNPTPNGDVDAHNPQRLLRIDSRLAEKAEVLLVHSLEHWDWVESLGLVPEDTLRAMGRSMDSVYLHPMTHYCACLSAGGCIEAARAVVMGKVKNAVAVIRPPGHHAEHNEPGGFCFFNNVCVAARVCQNDFPDLCRRILILDWDVHHGNGIQNAFYDDPNVLYISLHVHRDGKFYPNGPGGDHLHVGGPNAQGKNVNIPWPQHHMGDGDYLHAFQQVVMPVAQEFGPDLVIISAGFDAAEGDQLGQCHVTPECFAHMAHMLMSLANGRILAALEGGYNLRSIAKSAAAVTKTLMGEPPGRVHDIEPSLAGVATAKMVIGEQAKFWRCLHPKETPETRLHRMGGERLHDILRETQMLRWFREFGMSPLSINREKLSRSFDNQVLATDDFVENKPLLIIFHDPPETINIHDPNASKLNPHRIIVTDVAQQYVQQAIKDGFAVIDVNIPTYLTSLEGDTENNDYRFIATQEVASYLWENYVEVNNPSDVVLLGIGSAALGIIHLLNTHERTSDMVSCAISFVAEQTLQGVNRPADDYFPGWYFSHSKVFVAENHSVWSPDRQRKLRKKYGRLIKSSSTNIGDMLLEHKDQVFQKIRAETASNWEGSSQLQSQISALPGSTVEDATVATTTNGLAHGIEDGTNVPDISTKVDGERTNNGMDFGDRLTNRRTASPGIVKEEVTSPLLGTPRQGSPSAAGLGPLQSPLRSPGVPMPPIGMFTVTNPDRTS